MGSILVLKWVCPRCAGKALKTESKAHLASVEMRHIYFKIIIIIIKAQSCAAAFEAPDTFFCVLFIVSAHLRSFFFIISSFSLTFRSFSLIFRSFFTHFRPFFAYFSPPFYPPATLPLRLRAFSALLAPSRTCFTVASGCCAALTPKRSTF
jgi:hypothetical protein